MSTISSALRRLVCLTHLLFPVDNRSNEKRLREQTKAACDYHQQSMTGSPSDQRSTIENIAARMSRRQIANVRVSCFHFCISRHSFSLSTSACTHIRSGQDGVEYQSSISKPAVECLECFFSVSLSILFVVSLMDSICCLVFFFSSCRLLCVGLISDQRCMFSLLFLLVFRGLSLKSFLTVLEVVDVRRVSCTTSVFPRAH